MRCLVLARCVAAAVEQSAACFGAATYPEDGSYAAGFFEYPGACSVCGMEVLGGSTGLGNVWNDANAFFDCGKCPFCGWNTIHLGCALGSQYQVNCCNCGGAICRRFNELDVFIERLRSDNGELVNDHIYYCALDGLKSMEHSLIILTLRSYDMTIDELAVLKNSARRGGMCYSNVTYVADCIMRVKSVARAQIREIVTFTANARALAVVLPILSSVVTPHFVAEAGEEQTETLIKLFAGHRGANAGISGALAKRVIDLADILGSVQYTNNGIKALLYGLIGSNSCSVVKHLIGRHRFSHQFTDDNICAIIEHYTASCAYDDEAFVPLAIFLVSGDNDIASIKHKIQRLIERLLARNSEAAATPAYIKLQEIFKRCKLGAVSIMNAINKYACIPEDRDASASEDLFCAIVGTWDARNVFVQVIGGVPEEKGARAVRYIPSSWTRREAKICVSIAEQAIRQKNFAVLEEVLITLMNVKQLFRNMRWLFENLIKSNNQDSIGLMLRIINYAKLYRLKNNGITDWLLEQMVGCERYWCVPYFRGLVKNKARYEQIISERRQEIIEAIVLSDFRFSPIMRDVIRYDTGSAFIIENLWEYLSVLLKAPADRHIVQRVLIETCSMQAFDRMINERKMAAIYELFKEQQDCIFYLDAFYYALRHTTHRKGLKILLIDALEDNTVAKNQWVIASMASGALHRMKEHERCHGYKCIGCEYCKIVYHIPIEDLLAALRYARINQYNQ